MSPYRAGAAGLLLAGAALTAGTAPVVAQEIEYAGIRSGKYKMTDYRETGEKIPVKGPVIEVFSSSGAAYDTIANDNEGLWFTMDLRGSCAGNQIVGDAEVRLPDSTESLKVRKRKTFARRYKKVTLRSGFVLPDIGRSPANACMKELERRVVSGNLSRIRWMERGFVVKYEDAYALGFALTCNRGRGWNQYGEAQTRSPVWIACQAIKDPIPQEQVRPRRANSGANETAPRRLTGGIKGMPEKAAGPQRADLAKAAAPPARLTSGGPLVTATELEAEKAVYRGGCPIAVRFSGTISASRRGKVKYRLVGHDGANSPLRGLRFSEAGTQRIAGWTKTVGVAGDKGEGGAGADYRGWMRIEVVEPKSVASSAKVHYAVTCARVPESASAK